MSGTDWELINRYVRTQAEDAFAELVRRHLGVVYGAALRQLRSTQLAEEAAQGAFIDLARQAGTLKPNTILASWLYRVTRCKAIDIVRRESSRQAREKIASDLNFMNAPTNSDDWARIEPLLDEAIETLDETDRAAVILRYFENKSLRDVGERIGASENAAQKRLTRAIDRLRDHFTKNGVTITSAAVIATISANAAPVAPAALATAITAGAGAVAVTAAVATSAATGTGLALGTIPKAILATAAAGAIAVGVVEESRISNLRAENEGLRASHAALVESVQTHMNERDLATNRLAQISKANEEMGNGGGELHRLRAEVVRLRAEDTRLRALASEWGQANEALRLQINGMNEQIVALAGHVSGAARGDAKAALTPEQQCINNLRQIDGATEQWALENRKPAGSEFRSDDIKDYVLGQQIPKCPSGGTYAFGKVDMTPTCTVAGHSL